MHGNSDTVSTKRRRIAELARRSPQMGFTSLAYLMDIDWMREAWRLTRKNGAVGVDGQTAADYERDLEANLRSLLDRAKSGTYRAPPVRRVHIPKGGSTTETRPIGIPTVIANCTFLQPAFGMGSDRASIPSTPRRAVPDSQVQAHRQRPDAQSTG